MFSGFKFIKCIKFKSTSKILSYPQLFKFLEVSILACNDKKIKEYYDNLISKYLNNGKYFNDAVLKGFYMPPERSMDIDSELDWDIVKYLFEKKFNHE